MKKRIISLILTLAMVSGLFVNLGTTVTANGVNHNANSNDLCNMLTYAYNAMQFSSPKYYITHHNINNVYNAASLKKNFEDSPTTAIVNSLKDSSGWEQFSTLVLLLLKTAFDFDGELTQQDLYDTLLISMLLEGAVEEANDITALSNAQSLLSDIFSLDVTISDKAAPVAVPLFNYLKTSVNRTAFWNSLKEALKKASIDETNDVLTFTANGDTISIHSGLILDFITWATNKKISADTITEITKTLDKLFKILDYGFTTLGELDEFYTNITKAFMIWKCVDEGALVLLEQMRTHTDDNLLKNAINKYIQLINSGSIIGFIECVMQNFVELEVELSCNLLAKIFKNEVLSKFPIYAAGSLVFTVFNLAGNLSQKAEMIYIVHCLNTVNETVIQSIQDIEKICVDGWKSISSVPYCDGYVSGMLMAYRLLSTELDYATEYLTTWYGTDKFNAYFGNNEAWDQWKASIAHIRNLYDTVKPKNFMDNALERYSGHLDVIIKGLTVIYDLNGGEGNIPSQVKPFDGSIYLSDTIPTRRGYTFLGWSVKGELYQSGEELGLYLKDHNTTLRPCWCSDELVITAQWEEAPLPNVPSTFADAKAIVDFSSTAIGVTKGRIRYMTQLTGDKECYVKDYWKYTINGTTGILSSGNKCTRCALSMALSYLGLDYTPGYMSTLYGNTDIPSPLVDVPKLIPSITKVDGTFDTLFNNYASDSGFSPVVVYFDYKHPNDGEIHSHAVLINGKNGDTYYAVDSAANVTKLVELTFNADRTAITSSSYARYADTSSIQGFNQWKLSGTPDPGPVDPEPTSYTLSGVIRNATEDSADYGKEVEGVTVTRKTADGTVIDSTTTDSNGTFSFTFTGEKGDYIFMFSKNGFQTKETAVITIYQSSPSLGAFVIYEEEGEVEIVDQGTCGTNLTWTLNSAGTLTISGKGEMEDYQYDCGPWKDYCYSYNETKPQIKRIVVNDGVTTIGKYAFNGCKRATSVYLSNTLAEIDWHAFANCEQLVNIELPDSLLAIRSSAFYRCSSLTSITIPKNVWIIESRPFYDCTNLSYIHVNNENESFRDIDGVLYKVSKTWIYEKQEYEYSFTELLCCPAGSSLTEVLIPDTVTSIAMDAFANCTALLNITIPSSVTEIKSGVFFRCSNLKNIVLHDAITRIGSLSFNGCQKLQELNLPQELNYIDDTALGDCYCLSRIYIDDSNSNYCTDSAGVLYNKAKTILFKFPARSDVANYTIPSTVTKINDDAMQNCIYLENIELPKNLVEIGWSAFENCVKLQSITIPETVTTIGHSAFSGCTNLTDVFLPDTIPNFGSGVFKRCTNLQKISLPKNMTKLPDVTFSECTSLTTIIWPIALEKIGYMSFSKCSSLTEITIPETVYEIGNYNVFEECTNLTKVILSDAITTLGSSIFRNCINLTDIHLPDSLISLGRNNFDGCTSLKRIDIPESLTVFERQNFYGAKNLTSVYFYGDAPTIPAGTFDNFSNLTFYYISDKSGWTSPTWTASNGVTYNTATFTPGSVDPNPTVPGDLTGDGVLDYFDVSAIYAAYQSGEVDADTMDVNNDGVVDYYDVSKFYAAFRGTATLT